MEGKPSGIDIISSSILITESLLQLIIEMVIINRNKINIQ